MPAIAFAAFVSTVRADAIESADVDDGMHHEDIANADPLLDLAAGQGANHELRHAERQGAHRRGADGGAGRPAETENAVDLALAMQLDDELGGP